MKRFYQNVSLELEEDEYFILLDGKKIKTPKGNFLSTANKGRAEAIQQEWEEQHDSIQPDTMPFTKFINSTKDNIIPNREEITQTILRYTDHDCLYYFDPNENEMLFQRQMKEWLPIIQAFEKQFQLKINYGTSLTLSPQDPKLRQVTQQFLNSLPPEDLAALYMLITIMGSVILAVMAYYGVVKYDDALEISRLEENCHITQWGLDIEQEKSRKALEKEYNQAIFFLSK